MRATLQEILEYTYNNTLFNFLKLYHIKSEVVEIIPDLTGTITRVDVDNNQLVTTTNNVPWLESKMKVRFEGVSTEIDPAKYYYVKNIVGDTTCVKFSIGETELPGEILPITTPTGSFNIKFDRSYLIVKDTSWLDVGMRLVFEEFPIYGNKVSLAGLQLLTKYFVYDILEDNKIRVSLSQHLPNTIKDSHYNFLHFNNATTTSFEIIQDHTFIEGVTEDKIVYLDARTDEKIANFNAEFGMFDLYKLFNHLENLQEYPTDNNITVNNIDENNEFVSTKLNFDNPNDTFKDEWQLIDKTVVPSKHEMIDFKNSLWNFSLNLTELQKSRFDKMALAYADYLTFDLYTNNQNTNIITGIDNNSRLLSDTLLVSPSTKLVFSNPSDSSNALTSVGLLPNTIYYVLTSFGNGSFTISDTLNGNQLLLPYSNFSFEARIATESSTFAEHDLEFYFGEDDPNFGKITFEKNIKGTYIPRIIDEFKTITKTVAEYTDTIYRQVPSRNYFIGPFLNEENEVITIKDTSILKVGSEIQFSNPPDSADAVVAAGLDPIGKYYVKEILDCERFTFSDSLGGPAHVLPFTNFELFLTVELNIYQIFDFNASYVQTNGKELWKYLEPNMPIKFRNPPDSTDALLQAELDPTATYYVKDITKFYDGEESFLVTGVDNDGILSLDVPADKEFIDVLYPGIEVYFENLPDSANALIEAELQDPINPDPYKKYYIKEVYRDGFFTLSEEPNGEQLSLPYSNFEFEMKMDFVRLEFTISETIGGPIKPVPYSNFEFSIYHEANELEVDDTSWFRLDMPIQFESYNDPNAITEATLSTNQQYYVKNILNNHRLQISDTLDGEVLKFFDTPNEFFIRHDTGNGFVLSSYSAQAVSDIGKPPVIYTRQNLYHPDLDPIPNEIPYEHIFNGINLPLPQNSTLWVPYYYEENDYTYGRHAWSPVFTPDYTITVTVVDEKFVMTGEDRIRTFDLETMPSLTFAVGDRVQFSIDPSIVDTHPFWIKTKQEKKTKYFALGSYGNGTPTVNWTVEENNTYFYLCPRHIHMAGNISVPPSLPPINPEYKDQNVVRGFDTRRPVSLTELNNKYVYAFEVGQNLINNIKNNPTLTGAENQVKLFVNDRNSYLMPVSYLDKRWTYNVPQILAIQLLNGDKIMRISDEGRLMITVKSPNGIYNYILPGTEKT